MSGKERLTSLFPSIKFSAKKSTFINLLFISQTLEIHYLLLIKENLPIHTFISLRNRVAFSIYITSSLDAFIYYLYNALSDQATVQSGVIK